MALLGRGVAAIWHNVPPEVEEDYNRWHMYEHVPERVGIPGFLRGRRYVAVEGLPKYFHFYETDDVATLTSTAYVERLNNPTVWTQRIGPMIRDNVRTLSQVLSSSGRGVGGAMLTARISAPPQYHDRLAAHLTESLSGQLQENAGVIGIHILAGDHDASSAGSRERELRGGTDGVADFVLLVDASKAGDLTAVHRQLSDPTCLAGIVIDELLIGIYQLHMELCAAELSNTV